jgi:flagellar basal-body rod protein FlgG
MNQGVYISLSGAKLQELRLEILANNLANTNTPGYKADKVTSGSFSFEMDQALEEIHAPIIDLSELDPPLESYNGVYSKTRKVVTNFAQGNHRFTGNPLNIALEGPGFFALKTPNGIRYTRQGSFELNRKGEIVTAEGHTIRGKGLSGLEIGIIDINTEGNVYVDGIKKGSIDIVEFDNPEILRKEGQNRFVLKSDGGFEKKPKNTIVKQGFLEMPNIKVVKEMVNLIELNRIYEAYQKSIITMDESTKMTIEEVGG